jgi:predicted signal transduction protein with EAL and GGDEF domain
MTTASHRARRRRHEQQPQHRTTAEGVETHAQLERLKSEGCTEAQGYLFSPPRSAADVKTWLAALVPEAGDGTPPRQFGGK